MTDVAAEFYFSSPIYIAHRPDFLENVSAVSEEYLAKNRECTQSNAVYPLCMSGTYHDDPRIADFSQFIADTAWHALDSQGYDMSNFATNFSEMWTQEHHRSSSMDQHVHGYGSQMVGFYFLETPENCSRVVFHDPRPSKVIIDLPQKDINQATLASQMINFEPKPGMIVMTNSWLSHSFTRNASDQPIKFVHFNLHVVPNLNTREVEVV